MSQEEFFQQLFAPAAGPAAPQLSQDQLFDDWLVQDVLLDDTTPTASVADPASPIHSSPVTPPDSFLSTPPAIHIKHETQIPPLPQGPDDPLTVAIAALMAAASSPVPAQQPHPVMTPLSTPQMISEPASPLLKLEQPEPIQHQQQQQPQRGKKRASSDEPLDEAALKRQKNTDAARRSRLRKVMKMEALEKQVAELEKTKTSLLLRVAVLDAEKAGLQSKEASYEARIKMLESQLADAHVALQAKDK
ncbi:hypothetical protein BCR43DRAFT_563783 [Syncephalastrum racemosum]|uniref:BZIP domain-containing protein n=1 Tax=Syncephalastrum racemosum TaxID=13706 RepID=A0A1X2HCH5_SYNRA|nr:hypothetical protein BCR43DRAFT_563783 [Syncephalastrum racemosum]